MIISMFKDTVVITNRHLVKGDYLEQIRQVLSLHPCELILREKDLSDEEYERLSAEVLELCAEYRVSCYLHSRYETARKLGCKNIHLSVTSLLACEESLLGFEKISVSCHSLADVKNALAHGATQIILGTIFETECKKGLKGQGLSFVKEISDYCRANGNIPVFAIGGITPENIELVKAAGARGGCMMSYMMRYSKS